MRETGDRQQGAARKFPVGENLLPQFDERIAVPRIVDEHRHGHEIAEFATHPLQRLPDQGKTRARLRLEIMRDRLAGEIDRGRLPPSQTVRPPRVTMAGEKARDF